MRQHYIQLKSIKSKSSSSELFHFIIQCDQKENKSEEALQIIISHVVAEFYANKRSMHGRRQFVVSNTTVP
jgi:hypothetical protein